MERPKNIFQDRVEPDNENRMLMDEEVQLIRRFQTKIAGEDKRFENEFVKSFDWLVEEILQKYFNTASKADFDDLRQIGRLALVRTARSFDESKGKSFSHIVRYSIWSEMAKLVDRKLNLIRIPRNVMEVIRRIIAHEIKNEKSQATSNIQQELGLTQDEYADAMEIRKLLDIASLDETVKQGLSEQRGSAAGVGVYESIDPVEAQEDEIYLNDVIQDAVKNASLTDREREFIVLRFGLSNGKMLSLQDVGLFFGVGESYASRIETAALDKIAKYRKKSVILHQSNSEKGKTELSVFLDIKTYRALREAISPHAQTVTIHDLIEAARSREGIGRINQLGNVSVKKIVACLNDIGVPAACIHGALFLRKV